MFISCSQQSLPDGPRESPWYQDHIEIVISGHPKSDMEIFLVVLVEHKKREMMEEEKAKLEIQCFHCAKRHREASLKRVKHLVEARPQPPVYS